MACTVEEIKKQLEREKADLEHRRQLCREEVLETKKSLQEVEAKYLIHAFERNVRRLETELRVAQNKAVKVGDGITLCLYSDSNAYTIIKRTKKTIVIQRDKATLNPSFKPHIIAGGFCGHCDNQNEQTWTYERDTKGEIKTIHWSNKYGCWNAPKGYRSCKLGRHEFYDYNF